MAVKKKIADAVPAEEKETKYTKRQLVSAKRYTDSRDILNAVLADKRKYSIEDADKAIADFKKGKVK